MTSERSKAKIRGRGFCNLDAHVETVTGVQDKIIIDRYLKKKEPLKM
jgi:hypothetical protein